MKKRSIIKLTSILTPVLIFFLALYVEVKAIPNTIYVRDFENAKISNIFTLEKSTPVNNFKSFEGKTQVKLLGMVPVKNVNINEIPDLELYPGGTPIGIKMNTKGLLVVAFSDVRGEDGKIQSPGALAGLNIGDVILKANNKELNTSNELIKIINEEKGEKVKLIVERKGEIFEKEIKPIKFENEDKYKIGIWLRDSTAGVGTLTFYHKGSNAYGALGHPITDMDTNSMLKVGNGSIVEASIINVRKGIKGNPGELKGIFVNEDTSFGNINSNTECGIFGVGNGNISNSISKKPLKIGLRNEIKEGKAQIITTVDESGPQYYDIVIEKLLYQDNPGSKSMVIKITDPKLLEKTGGIVQGMSGSPIIQNDKIVGAITHVLINKPDTGYGIYIEWMIKDSNILAK